jgi:hypothetical protein
MPIYEKSPPTKTNSKNGRIPILSIRYGILNMPEPIALASNANIDPLIAPAFNGAKALCTKVRFSIYSAE